MTIECGGNSVAERRSNLAKQLPELEDTGLFKSGITKMVINVVPEIRRNNRDDLIVTGFVMNTEIEVLFAGRRRHETFELRKQLRQLRTAENPPKLVRTSKVFGKDPEVLSCMPLALEGAWRNRYWYDDEWSVHRVYQFIAARWILTTPDGEQLICGTASVASSVQQQAG